MAKTLLIAIHLKDTLNLVHFQFASSILGYGCSSNLTKTLFFFSDKAQAVNCPILRFLSKLRQRTTLALLLLGPHKS